MGGGAWGCYRSHLNIIEQCLMDGTKSVLLMEDDALCVPEFTQRVNAFMAAVPQDWEILYLGGQHLCQGKQKPVPLNDLVVKPYNVNRTHAWALRGKGLQEVYRHLNDTKVWRHANHIDHHMGHLIMSGKMKAYAPTHWLIGQNEGHSTVSQKIVPQRFWNGKDVVIPEDREVSATGRDYVIIVGLHRSGSSLLANVLRKLGVYMGDKFGGCESDGGGEAIEILRICERAMPFPQMRLRMTPHNIKSQFATFVKKQWDTTESLCGAKYPHFCVFAPYFTEICKARLHVIHAQRSLEHSIASLVKRSGKRHDHQKLENLQGFLWQEKNRFLKTTPHLTVQYDEMIDDPAAPMRAIVEHLKLEVSDAQIKAALNYVQPHKRHFSSK
jgi:hypothetical protein